MSPVGTHIPRRFSVSLPKSVCLFDAFLRTCCLHRLRMTGFEISHARLHALIGVRGVFSLSPPPSLFLALCLYLSLSLYLSLPLPFSLSLSLARSLSLCASSLSLSLSLSLCIRGEGSRFDQWSNLVSGLRPGRVPGCTQPRCRGSSGMSLSLPPSLCLYLCLSLCLCLSLSISLSLSLSVYTYTYINIYIYI